jgi:hypothetical protein
MATTTNSSVICKKASETSSGAIEIHINYLETIGDCSEIPTYSSEIPTDCCEIPADCTEIPTDCCEIPTDCSEIPADCSEIPTDCSEIFADKTEKCLYHTEIKALMEEYLTSVLGQILTITKLI